MRNSKLYIMGPNIFRIVLSCKGFANQCFLLEMTPLSLGATSCFYLRQISWHDIRLCKHWTGAQRLMMVGFPCTLTQPLLYVIKTKCSSQASRCPDPSAWMTCSFSGVSSENGQPLLGNIMLSPEGCFHESSMQLDWCHLVHLRVL